MKRITEADKNILENWRKRAGEIATMDEFVSFFEGLVGEKRQYAHDYGTICHAIAAISSAAGHLANKQPTGQITGFQAGAVMWEFINQWGSFSSCTKEIRDYGNMLYPQYGYKFRNKEIPQDTWDWLQREAREKLEESPYAAPNVVDHWQSIVDGEVPFGYVVKAVDNDTE